jgi:hypothetical protein
MCAYCLMRALNGRLNGDLVRKWHGMVLALFWLVPEELRKIIVCIHEVLCLIDLKDNN